MKLRFLSLFLVGLTFSGCSCETVPPGYVGIKVDLYGEKKGVGNEVLSVGRYTIGVGEELFVFPTFEQNYVWTKSAHEGKQADESISFQTKEGLSVNGDFGITFHIPQEKVITVFQKYRKGVEEITDIFLRNHVRDAINSIAAAMPVESVYGEGKTDLMKKVLAEVQKEVGPLGIDVSKVYIVGDFRLPQPVVDALNAKIQATQKAMQIENELKQAEAEGRKKVAAVEADAKAVITKAEAEAKANKLLSDSLSQNLVQYRQIEIDLERIKKWNGQLPVTIMGGMQPMMNVESLLRK